jgi:hypothetical protein
MFVLIVFAMWGVVFLTGLALSAAALWITVLLVAKRAKERPGEWLFFGVASGVVLFGALLFMQSRPKAMDIPNSVDFRNLVLNSFGYGSSLGVAALIGGLTTWISPRSKRTRSVPPPLPKKMGEVQAIRNSDQAVNS